MAVRFLVCPDPGNRIADPGDPANTTVHTSRQPLLTVAVVPAMMYRFPLDGHGPNWCPQKSVSCSSSPPEADHAANVKRMSEH